MRRSPFSPSPRACLPAAAALAALVACASSCALFRTGGGELTAEEKGVLADYARKIICATVPDKRLSPADKRTVLQTEPEVIVKYTGHKRGECLITWHLNKTPDGAYTRSVTYKASGDLLEPEDSFRGLVVNSEPPPVDRTNAAPPAGKKP